MYIYIYMYDQYDLLMLWYYHNILYICIYIYISVYYWYNDVLIHYDWKHAFYQRPPECTTCVFPLFTLLNFAGFEGTSSTLHPKNHHWVLRRCQWLWWSMMIYIWFPWSLINFGDNDHWFNDSMIIDFSDNVIISIIDIDHVMVILIRKKTIIKIIYPLVI